MSPNVTATCGQSVTLHCNVSSNQGRVYHLSWIKDNITLCKVKDDHLVDDEQPTSDVECRYANKSMFVTFRQTSKEQQERALDEYICKLRSYQGPAIKKTWVELKGQRPVGEGQRSTLPYLSIDGHSNNMNTQVL